MDYQIKENKVKSVFFKYLSDLSELDVDMVSRYSYPALAYYPVAYLGYEEDDYEPVMESFVYYPDKNSYEWVEETYEPKEFPLIELDTDIYNKIIEVFGDQIFYTYSPEWFSKKINKPVKNVYAN